MTYGFLLLGLVICLAASIHVKSTFKKYDQVPSMRGYTGSEVARMILDANGLYHVSVQMVSGSLTDHFTPSDNTVYLSESTYRSRSVAALGVAAHECGHALQYQENYAPLKVRSTILPAVNISSKLWYWIFLIGIITSGQYGSTVGYLLQTVGIVLFLAICIFQLITLPVEFNASHRALKQLEQNYYLQAGNEMAGARKVLTAAALTYVASLMASLLQVLRLLAVRGRRR